MMRRCVMVCGVLSVLLMVSMLRADVFSVGSGHAISADPADLLAAGPVVHVPGSLGLVTGDDIDALSQGADIVNGGDIIYFSVDGMSVGVPGLYTDNIPFDVCQQAALGQQAGDIYVTIDGNYVQSVPGGFNGINGYNSLDVNQNAFGLVPNGPAGQFWMPYSGDQDNLDAYSMEEFDYNSDQVPDRNVYFSLAAGSPTLVGAGLSAADIIVYDSAAQMADVLFTYSDLGLQAGDDLDALALNLVLYDEQTGTGAKAYFSLAQGSPSLAANGFSAADVFCTDFDGAFEEAYSAEMLGLLESDNVDALETNAAPEPATMALLLMGGLTLIRRRK